MVVAEVVVVVALLALAWNVIGSAMRQASPAPVASAPGAPADDQSPLPDIPGLTGQPKPGPVPGLNLNSAFWRARLIQLNRDQVVLSDLEWRVVHAGMNAAMSYVEDVVLPAVRRAERAV